MVSRDSWNPNLVQSTSVQYGRVTRTKLPSFITNGTHILPWRCKSRAEEFHNRAIRLGKNENDLTNRHLENGEMKEDQSCYF